MFVRNHCCTTILIYSHFLVPPCVPDPINQSTCNQSIFQKNFLVSYFSSPSFIGFMYTFYSRIQSFHALTPAGASVVHKSNSTQNLNVVFVVLDSFTVVSDKDTFRLCTGQRRQTNASILKVSLMLRDTRKY